LADGDFGQVIAQDVQRVHAVHGGRTLGVVSGVHGQTLAVPGQPGIGGGAVYKEVTHRAIGLRVAAMHPRQRAEKQGEVDTRGMQGFKECIKQGRIVGLLVLQTEFCA
jgi:hypothetical protein